ncbi:MAG: hypothetical protein M9941_10805 [Anaerolineae bacterium]|nr:hypothetical protein [Anaerolineae bacterium]
MIQRQAQKAFDKQLKLTLKHLHQPEWLAANSPLASSYFLTRQTSNGRTADLGVALQQAIYETARSLWGTDGPSGRAEIERDMAAVLLEAGQPRYHYLVLELRYLQQYFRPRRMAQIWDEFLGESRAEFYRDLDEAIRVLGEALLRRLHPTFRPETPVTTGPLFGRKELIAQCLTNLQTGTSVTLSGAGGIGKTSLGSEIASQWGGPVFWFTIRPTLNDTLNSLLYSLGYYLHKLGANGLWQALLADNGSNEDTNLALGLARYDLNAVAGQSPLLCFDEFDRLRAAEMDNPVPHHQQLLEFVEGLAASAPLLLIGQHPVLDTPVHHALSGLTVEQIAALLQKERISYLPYEVAELHAYTGGNPRLIQLVVALRQQDESLAQLLRQLPETSALQPLLDRLFMRSTPGERQLLYTLSVFRSQAPADALAASTRDLNRLVARQLVQRDSFGGCTMWPALRDVILGSLSAENRELYHLQAAAIRAARGEYTATSYHYWQAGFDKEAVQFWFPHRHQEIERGQAGSALAIFENISLNRLPKKSAEALSLMRAELKQLAGDLAGGLSDLQAITWPDQAEITLRAGELRGQFLNARGYPDRALTTYQDGLETAARISNQMVRFRNRSSRVHVRQGSLEPARREAQLAQFEALNLQGVIQGKQGHYAQAYKTHEQALALAEQLTYTRGMAQAHHDMATLLVYLGDIDRVIEHTRLATDYYMRIGDQHFAEMARINLAATLIQAQRFSDAADAAQAALTFFERVDDPYGCATAAANLAEAYCELGELDKAHHFAGYVLQLEEPHTIPFALYTLGSVARQRGNSAEAQRYFTASADYGEQNGEKFIQAYALRALGRVLLDDGETEIGRSHLDHARKLFIELELTDEVAATQQI